MRIIFAVNSLYFLRSHRHPLVAEARRRGWEVHIVSGPDHDERDHAARTVFNEIQCQLHAIPLTRSGTGPFDLLQTVRGIRDVYEQVRPELVHHITPKLVTLGSIAARRARVPAVVNAISGLGFMFSGRGAASRLKALAATALYGAALRHSNQVIVVQNDRDRSALERLRLPKGTRFEHFYGSGVDLSKFVPTPIPDGAPVAVLAARLLRDKGILDLAAAGRLLRARGVELRLVLCGSLDPGNPGGLTQAELDSLVQEGVVEYWGQRSDMFEVYSQATLACLPSYYGEGLPLALAEAAAAGRAVVTTDLPGCRDTVRADVSGYLVPPQDPVALADALGRIASDRETAERMGRESRRLAEERFAVEVVVAGHFRIYEELMRSNRREDHR